MTTRGKSDVLHGGAGPKRDRDTNTKARTALSEAYGGNATKAAKRIYSEGRTYVSREEWLHPKENYGYGPQDKLSRRADYKTLGEVPNGDWLSGTDVVKRPGFDNSPDRKVVKTLGGGGNVTKSPFSKAHKTY